MEFMYNKEPMSCDMQLVGTQIGRGMSGMSGSLCTVQCARLQVTAFMIYAILVNTQTDSFCLAKLWGVKIDNNYIN